jgi:hypothetical protein
MHRSLLFIAMTLLMSSVPGESAADQAMPIIVVGSNAATDADTINAAIAASPRGAEIVIRGPCLINKTIRLLDNRSYRGESRTGTLLKQADGANLVALMANAAFLDNGDYTGEPVEVRQLTLDGNQKHNAQAQTDGLILRSWLSVVEGVCITNMTGNGLRVTNRSADGTKLKNSQVNGRIAGNFIENSGGHGIYIEDTQNAVTDWILTDNWIASSGLDGIHLDNAAGWFIEHNHIYGVGHDAISANSLFATAICDNYIEDFGETKSPGTWCGIRATLNGGNGSTIAANRIFNVNMNRRSQADFHYLDLAVNYGTGMVAVTGNVISGTGTPRETAQCFMAGDNRKLTVVSVGNLIEGVETHRLLGSHVTVSAGE